MVVFSERLSTDSKPLSGAGLSLSIQKAAHESVADFLERELVEGPHRTPKMPIEQLAIHQEQLHHHRTAAVTLGQQIVTEAGAELIYLPGHEPATVPESIAV